MYKFVNSKLNNCLKLMILRQIGSVYYWSIFHLIIWRRVFYWKLNTCRFHTPLHLGPEWCIFRMQPLWVSYRSMTSWFHSNDITIPEDSRRYEFYVLVARTISHSFVSLTHEILFLPLKHKIYIFSPPCNILYL